MTAVEGLDVFGLEGLSMIERLSMAVPLHKATSPRAQRRRLKRSRNRGLRPTDEVEAKTTQWYRRDTKKRQPMLKCTATLPVLTREGKLEMRTRRRRFAPAPNLRRDFAPVVENDEPELGLWSEDGGDIDLLPAVIEEVPAITKFVAQATDSDVVLEEAPEVSSVAVVVMPPLTAETGEEPDWGDPDKWDLGRYEPRHLPIRG